MAKAGLSIRRVEGIGEGSLVGTLSRLLQLTCEAVLIFDGAGRVLLANDEASELLGISEGLVGADVRASSRLPTSQRRRRTTLTCRSFPLPRTAPRRAAR